MWAARLKGPPGFDKAGFDKIVALKTMLPELARETEYREMFLDEARVTSRLQHPNLCETFDVGELHGELFLAMEWIDGVSLYRLFKPDGRRGQRVPLRVAAKIIAEACAGLHAAHEALDDDGASLAVVHRDVSPQNLLLSADGQVKVTDFGVAEARGKLHQTVAGQAKGKLAYMAPEQLRDAPLDRRSDVFSLGCVLYEITTGRKPFEAATDADVARAILRGEAPRPSAIVADYPPELERIVARAMASDPSLRFAAAEGLRLALERWAAAAGGLASQREVAAFVRERCGAEIDARRAELAAARSNPPAAVVPATPERARRTPRSFWAMAAAVACLAVGSLAWSRPAVAPTTAAGLAAPAKTTPAETVTETVTTATLTHPPAPATVAIQIEPKGASLLVDGEPTEIDEDGRATVERPATGELRVGIAKAEGYVDRLFVVQPDGPSAIAVKLTPNEPAVLTSR